MVPRWCPVSVPGVWHLTFCIILWQLDFAVESCWSCGACSRTANRPGSIDGSANWICPGNLPSIAVVHCRRKGRVGRQTGNAPVLWQFLEDRLHDAGRWFQKTCVLHLYYWYGDQTYIIISYHTHIYMNKKDRGIEQKSLRHIKDQEVLLERKEGGKEGKKGNNSMPKWMVRALCGMYHVKWKIPGPKCWQNNAKWQVATKEWSKQGGENIPCKPGHAKTKFEFQSCNRMYCKMRLFQLQNVADTMP